jgi:hypothetical protein
MAALETAVALIQEKSAHGMAGAALPPSIVEAGTVVSQVELKKLYQIPSQDRILIQNPVVERLVLLVVLIPESAARSMAGAALPLILVVAGT